MLTPALILLSPVLAGLALLVRIKLGAPVFFRQQRPGLRPALHPLSLPHQQRPVGHRSRAVARAGAKSATQTGNLRVLPPCPGWRLPPRPPILGERDVFPPGLGGRGAAHQARFQSLACGGARPGQATSSLILRTLAAPALHSPLSGPRSPVSGNRLARPLRYAILPDVVDMRTIANTDRRRECTTH